MNGRVSRWAAVGGLAAMGMGLAVAPAKADRNQLWLIVSLKCMRHYAKSEAPVPCDNIDDSRGWDRGVALLKSSAGKARMLAIPTHPVAGIEDKATLAENEPNYFAAAWAAQRGFAVRLHAAPPPGAIAAVVDSKPARDQDQLHVIVDCLDAESIAALARLAPDAAEAWRPAPAPIKGRRYWVRRVTASRVEDVWPFRLLAADLPGAKDDPADWSLALTQPASLAPGAYLLLADKAEAGAGGRPQDLLDPACAVAQK